MDKLSEQMRKKAEELWNNPTIMAWADKVELLELGLDKFLKREYMDEDHRLGGTGRTFEEYKREFMALIKGI